MHHGRAAAGAGGLPIWILESEGGGPATSAPGRLASSFALDGEAMALARGDEFRVAFDGVVFSRGRRQVFRGLSCGFPRGQISVVLGGSGSGKNTLLRLIGGLERPDA